MTPSASALIVLALLATPPLAAAQAGSEPVPVDVKPGLADVKPGLTVSVVDEDGRKIEGRVAVVSEQALRLSRRGGSEEIPFDRIVRIDRPDSLKNGALVGLSVGLALGISGAAVQARGSEAKWVFASLLSNGVACTLLGTGIDALVDSRRTLYERGRRTHARVSPIVGQGVRGAALSVTW